MGLFIVIDLEDTKNEGRDDKCEKREIFLLKVMYEIWNVREGCISFCYSEEQYKVAKSLMITIVSYTPNRNAAVYSHTKHDTHPHMYHKIIQREDERK